MLASAEHCSIALVEDQADGEKGDSVGEGGEELEVPRKPRKCSSVLKLVLYTQTELS